MTPSRYFAARFLQAFGIHRRQIRMGDAATEMRLLRESEAYLGSLIWPKVEDIEELSVEYWKLRKLLTEQEELTARLEARDEEMRAAYEARVDLLEVADAPDETLVAEREALLHELENLANRRDWLVNRARQVRKTYDGLKMKLEVVSGDAEEAAKVARRIDELKDEFARLKNERAEVGAALEEGDKRIDAIDSKLGAKRSDRREDAVSAFQDIGVTNREISTMRAQLGVINAQMDHLQSEIGRYISRNTRVNERCAEASREHRGLVDVMRSIRRSIALNHRLSGMS